MNRARDIRSALTRRKTVDQYTDDSNKPDSCFSTLYLISVGLGNRLVYAIHGRYSPTLHHTGPVAVLSCLLAAFVNFLSALCYAELASRMPKAGSAYAYSYVTIGEFVAFIAGWSLILKNIAAAAYLTRITSIHIAYLAAKFYPEIRHYVWWESKYSPDFESVFASTKGFKTYHIISLDVFSRANWLSGCVASLTFVISSIGFRRKRCQMICVAITLSFICIISVSGFIEADLHDWLRPRYFFPDLYGFDLESVIRSSKHLYYAFTGFDGIAAAKGLVNPSKSISKSILWTAGINSLIYIVGATFPTLNRLYHLDDKQLPKVSIYIGWAYDYGLSKTYCFDWVVKIGLVAGLAASYLAGLLAAPNLLCTMAKDKVIPEFFSIVQGRKEFPITATLFIGLFVTYYACVFNQSDLLLGGSISALLAYSLVSISVLLLRYDQVSDSSHQQEQFQARSLREVFTTGSTGAGGHARQPDRQTAKISRVLIWTQLVIAMLFVFIISYFSGQWYMMAKLDVFLMMVCSILIIPLLLLGVLLSRLPVVKSADDAFKLPCSPAIPMLSLCLNFSLLFDKFQDGLEGFLIWSALGLVIYFSNATVKAFRNPNGRSSEQMRQLPTRRSRAERPSV